MTIKDERGFVNKKSNVLGFPVDKVTLNQCVKQLDRVIKEKQRIHIVLVNAAKIVKAKKIADLANILKTAQYVGADGVPIVWASKLLGDPLPGRVNGTDLMNRLIELAATEGHSIYFLGAKQEVLENAVQSLKSKYPSLNIAGYRNGYFDCQETENRVVNEIAQTKANILLVGMSTPMKEYWVRKHYDNLNVNVVHGVGGSFDILGGITKRAPVWMQKIGLEWFYRLCQEPRRMWKRYLITNSIFVGMLFKQCILTLFGRRVY
jgi:N-acetylglucosaminyldiphosphoundecaprenol N-acetyl-beta-D-mannosaminyltransferase